MVAGMHFGLWKVRGHDADSNEKEGSQQTVDDSGPVERHYGVDTDEVEGHSHAWRNQDQSMEPARLFSFPVQALAPAKSLSEGKGQKIVLSTFQAFPDEVLIEGGRSIVCVAHCLLGFGPITNSKRPPAAISLCRIHARDSGRPFRLALCT